MTDRELLELAAKAAGHRIYWHVNDMHKHGRFLLVDEDAKRHDWKHWNPLRDDGDALRLAVKLQIDIKQYEYYVVAWFDGGYSGTGKIPYEGDPYASTRKAIVMAAAKLGESL